MSNPSNLYAEKVFAEHPIALWSLDDKADYLQLLDATQKDISQWTIDEEETGTVIETTSQDSQPFVGEKLFLLTGSPSTTEIKYTTIRSDALYNFSDINSTLGSFSVGSYIYSMGPYLYSIAIGYEYYDAISETIIQKIKNVPIGVQDKWLFISETFATPDIDADFNLVIKIGYYQSEDSSSEYQFLLNGISLGQWSEEFNSFSQGIDEIPLPSTIAIESSTGIEAKQYGISGTSGYYINKNKSLCAKNLGVPLVYGASNVTLISPNTDQDGNPKPSLIVPGLGFLNERGKYKEYTFEMWLRINSNTIEAKRIFGPISSSDGLYVDGAFLTLVIGNNFKSTYVGEWCRPMLIQITYNSSEVSLLLNGEQVISMLVEAKTLSFPTEINGSNKNQDWLGFYAYEDITPIEIDCISIYTYKVPEILAKRRWVFGQAVQSIENIDAAYNGSSASIDYTYSSYSSNYNYPTVGKWNQGILDNVIGDSTSLSIPKYELPTIYINNNNIENVYDACKVLQPTNLGPTNGEDHTFITFKPNPSLSVNGSFKFENMNILTEPIKSFYLTFKVKESTPNEQVLIFISNKLNSDYFSVYVKNNKIFYDISIDGTITILHEGTYTNNVISSVGLDIDKAIYYFGGDVATFFGSMNLLDITILNNKTMSKCFLGYLYRLGFSTKRNLNNINTHFTENGTAAHSENLIDHLSSYTLLPQLSYGKYYLDIGINSYWEDYIPLKYFAKYITKQNNENKYDVDFLQFNIDYPTPAQFEPSGQVDSWTYAELDDFYGIPIDQTYEVLDNYLYTGYKDYDDLAHNRSSFNYQFNTSKSLVRSYISFQLIKDGANAQPDYFTSTQPALKNGVIDLTSSEDWQTTKYETVNDMIIYPPKSVSFEDLAVVVHLNFNIKGIYGKQIKLKSLELASQSLNETFANPIGTRTGTNLYPYTKQGIYLDYKSKNPISIYKKSNPYLHLTRSSGIQVRGDHDIAVNRGVSLLINQSRSSEFLVSSVQMAMRYDQDLFPATPYEIFEIDTSSGLLKFYMVANSMKGDRAIIYAINSKTGKLENGIGFYLNGKQVSSPVISISQWNFIGILFSEPLQFNSYEGAINLNGPMLFNHISYYKLSALQKKQNSSTRIWDEVREEYVAGALEPVQYDWDYWENDFLWYGVLIRSSSFIYGTTPEDIYKTYIGTNKIITGDSGERTLKVSSDPITVYTDTLWQQYTTTPA